MQQDSSSFRLKTSVPYLKDDAEHITVILSNTLRKYKIVFPFSLEAGLRGFYSKQFINYMNKKNYYVDKEELAQELVKSQQQGACTDRLGEIFMLMAERFTRSPKYNAYPIDVLDDFRQAAVLKCLKSIKNFKAVREDGEKSNAFSYFTRAIETALWDGIARRKKEIRFISELTEKTLEDFRAANPQPVKF